MMQTPHMIASSWMLAISHTCEMKRFWSCFGHVWTQNADVILQ